MFSKFKSLVTSIDKKSEKQAEILPEENASPNVAEESPSGESSSELTLKEHSQNLNQLINSSAFLDEGDFSRIAILVNKYLEEHRDIDHFETKDLNALVHLEGYVFAKTNGKQKLVKKYYTPYCRSKTKPLEDAICSTNRTVDMLQHKVNQIDFSIEETIPKLKKQVERQQLTIENLQQTVTDLFAVTSKLIEELEGLQKQNSKNSYDFEPKESYGPFGVKTFNKNFYK